MIKIETIDVCGLKGAIIGMRHPYKNTEKSDSEILGSEFHLGEKDHDLALRLATSKQPSDAKFMRMIHIQADICAPLYWWKEMDQYKVATTTDSESTMHTISKKPFDISDFSTDYGIDEYSEAIFDFYTLGSMCEILNSIRELYLDKDAEFKPETYKGLWRMLIQLLPESYNQTRMWDANYQTLRNIYFQREGHKLSEWQTFREWIETLPYSEFITTKDI